MFRLKHPASSIVNSMVACAMATLMLALAGCREQSGAAPLVATDAAVNDQGQRASAHEPSLLCDLQGTTHRPFDDPSARAVVLVFVLPDCPLANSYVAELNRLQAAYVSRGVRWFMVHVDPALTEDAAAQHAREYKIELPVVLDSRHVWVRKAGATVTPEAALFSPSGDLLYRGRIDDQYIGFGKRRGQVTSHDLQDALEDILAGRPVARPRTEAVGCFIPEIETGE